MKELTTKNKMLEILPLQQGNLTIREWTRKDVDRLAGWPKYPFPYEGFEFSFRDLSSTKRDEMFRERRKKPDRISLVADHAKQPVIGYIAPMLINWETGTIGNFGFRIHPAWCNQGVGTSVLKMVADWSFGCGIKLWNMDVAASNYRAIRCYEKLGFARTGEMWREAGDLNDVNLNVSQYDFVRPHIRKIGKKTELRFWLMKLEAN